MPDVEEEKLQSLPPTSLFDFSYDDIYTVLDANAPFTTLDLKDEDASRVLRSRPSPSSPLLTPDSSSKDTPETRKSDIAENENLHINFDIEDADMPKAWMALDAQLSEELQNIGVTLPPMHSDEMILFYPGSEMMEIDTLKKSLDSLGGFLDPSVRGLSDLHPISHMTDTGYCHGSHRQNETSIVPKTRRTRDTIYLSTTGDATNRSIVRPAISEEFDPTYEHVNSCSREQEDQPHSPSSDAGSFNHATLEEIEEGGKGDEHSQTTSTPRESIEIFSRKAGLDLFSLGCSSALHHCGGRGDVIMREENGEDDDESEDNINESETEEETWSLRSGSLAIEESHLDRLPPLDEDWVISNALNKIKELLLEELVDYATYESTDGSEGSEGSKSRKRAREASPASSISPPLQSLNQPPQKRLRKSGRKAGDDGQSDDEKDETGMPPNSPGFSLRRLRCPFNQRQPEKYERAACKGGGFANIAKLKDHIKRVHLQPLRCLRCWSEMESEDAYAIHLQAEIFCDKRQEPLDDRLPYQTLKRLDFKKAPYAKAKDPEQKWKIHYSVLFPNDTEIPSPYYQHTFTPRQQQILYEALEEELVKKMTPAIKPIVQQIKRSIPAIIQNYKLRLLKADSDTPSRLVTLSDIDSERDARQQLASPPDSEVATSTDHSHAIKSKQPEQSGPWPSDSKIEIGQELCNVPSPVCNLGCHVKTPVCDSNLKQNHTQSPHIYLSKDISDSTQSPRAEDPCNMLPLLGYLPQSQNCACSTKGTAEIRNTPSMVKEISPRQGGNSTLKPGWSQAASHITEDARPLHFCDRLSPPLHDQYYTAPNNCDIFSQFDTFPIFAELDFFSDPLDVDHFRE